MTELDPDFLQISVGEIGQDLLIDCVVGERGRVLAKAKFFQPLRDVIGHWSGLNFPGDSLALPVG